MSVEIAKTIENLPIYQAGKPIEETKRELGLVDVVKLASNENPIGPSPRAAEAIRMAVLDLNRYPDAAGHKLKIALGEKLGVAPDEVLLGNGSNEILVLLMRAIAVPGKNIVIPWPSFIVYPLAGESVGLEVRKVALEDGFRHDADALIAACDSNTQAIVIGHPNNPTGTYFPKAGLEKILATIPESTLLVIDEAYVEYADAPDYVSGLRLRRKNVMVLRTMSKAYGLAGMRLGYAVADRKLLGYLDRVREPFNVNSLAQVGAIAALDDELHIKRVVGVNAEERVRTMVKLEEMGLKVTQTQANFVLIELNGAAEPAYNGLLKKGVIVRPLAPYGMPNHLRVSFGTRSENDRLLTALSEVLNVLE